MARDALRDDFYREYRLAMAECGLSRKDLAEHFRITPHVLTMWITGCGRRMTIGLARHMVRPLTGKVGEERRTRVIEAAVNRIVHREFGVEGFYVARADALRLFDAEAK